MKSKPCGDKNCRRFGKKLKPNEFPKNRTRPDGLNLYCRECSLRRVHEYRERMRAIKKARKAVDPKCEVARNPMVIPQRAFAFSKVYDAIQKGLTTRQAIRRETGLDYDSIGEALVELVYDCKAVKIEKREYHLAA